MQNKKGFFCISPENLEKLAHADATTICAYLIISSGTGYTNSQTSWSSTAVAKYAGCRWNTAKNAVQKLSKLGIIETSGSVTKPTHRINGHDIEDPSSIWLPNTLVQGVAYKENYPLIELRSKEKPEIIKILLELYDKHKLIEHSGVDPKIIRQSHTAEIIGEHGHVSAWKFTKSEITFNHEFSEKYSNLSKDDITFQEKLLILKKLGFIESHHTLQETENGEPLLEMGRTSDESIVYRKLTDYAVSQICPDFTSNIADCIILPVMSHIKRPLLSAGFRLKYRPHTKRTSIWFKETLNTNKRYLEKFNL